MKTKLMPTVHKDKEAEGVYSLVLKCATSCECTSVITVHQGWIRKVTVSGRQAFLSPCLKNKKGRGQVNKNQYVALAGSKPHRVLTHRCTHHLHLDEVSVSCDFLCLSPTSSKSRKTITGKTIYKTKPRGTASKLFLPLVLCFTALSPAHAPSSRGVTDFQVPGTQIPQWVSENEQMEWSLTLAEEPLVFLWLFARALKA